MEKLLTFNELKEKISEMEKVLEILNLNDNVSTKNYLLIEQILLKNNIEVERNYDCVNDILELRINCSDIKMRRITYIDNYINLEDAETTIIIHIHSVLKDMVSIIQAHICELDIAKEKLNNFIKIFNYIDNIMLSDHDEMATGIAYYIAYYILNDIFGIDNDIHVAIGFDSNKFIMFSENYCGLKFRISVSFYKLMESSPYSLLKFILNKVVSNKHTFLSKALYDEINIDYFKTNGIRTIIDDDKNIEIYNSYGNLLCKIILDDSEYSRAAVFLDDFIPRTWEFLDAISSYAHMVEMKYNKYLKDVK